MLTSAFCGELGAVRLTKVLHVGENKPHISTASRAPATVDAALGEASDPAPRRDVAAGEPQLPSAPVLTDGAAAPLTVAAPAPPTASTRATRRASERRLSQLVPVVRVRTMALNEISGGC